MIEKTLPTNYGVDATFWKWDGKAAPDNTGNLAVTFNGYVSVDAFNNGNSPLSSYVIQIPAGIYEDEASIETAILSQQNDLSDIQPEQSSNESDGGTVEEPPIE